MLLISSEENKHPSDLEPKVMKQSARFTICVCMFGTDIVAFAAASIFSSSLFSYSRSLLAARCPLLRSPCERIERESCCYLRHWPKRKILINFILRGQRNGSVNVLFAIFDFHSLSCAHRIALHCRRRSLRLIENQCEINEQKCLYRK